MCDMVSGRSTMVSGRSTMVSGWSTKVSGRSTIVSKRSTMMSGRFIMVSGIAFGAPPWLWRGNAGIGFTIPEPSTVNIAQIPFWFENIDPELVTFGRPRLKKNLTGQNHEILG